MYNGVMRTTVTLDPDSHAHVKVLMQERGITFKEALNAAIRAGAAARDGGSGSHFATQTFPLGGNPRVDLDRALRLAGQLEDEEITRELAARR
jgi:hypothetical protein